MMTIVVTFVSGVALAFIAAHSIGFYGDGYPTFRSPYPVILAIPALCRAPLLFIAATFAGFFWLWCAQLFAGEINIPARSEWLAILVAIGSAIWFVGGWNYGLTYQGRTYTFRCFAASMLIGLALLALDVLNLQSPSFFGSQVFHIMLFGWIATYGFPWLGECP